MRQTIREENGYKNRKASISKGNNDSCSDADMLMSAEKLATQQSELSFYLIVLQIEQQHTSKGGCVCRQASRWGWGVRRCCRCLRSRSYHWAHQDSLRSSGRWEQSPVTYLCKSTALSIYILGTTTTAVVRQ